MLSLTMLIYVTILILFMVLSKQACGWPTCSLQVTWCLQTPCWWSLC